MRFDRKRYLRYLFNFLSLVCSRLDSFVNSQEWTLSRSVPDLRIGIVGSLASGKSALVHRYLTGSYMQEESPEGGRFKKEIVIDGQSHLLLIRDEGGLPEMQVRRCFDLAVIASTSYNAYGTVAVFAIGTKLNSQKEKYTITKRVKILGNNFRSKRPQNVRSSTVDLRQ